jgi:hypothetical protein
LVLTKPLRKAKAIFAASTAAAITLLVGGSLAYVARKALGG